MSTIVAACRDAEGAPPSSRLVLAYLRLESSVRTWSTGTVARDLLLSHKTASFAIAGLIAEGLAREAPEAGPHQYTLTPAGRGGAQ